jgi:hypothetical protein
MRIPICLIGIPVLLSAAWESRHLYYSLQRFFGCEPSLILEVEMAYRVVCYAQKRTVIDQPLDSTPDRTHRIEFELFANLPSGDCSDESCKAGNDTKRSPCIERARLDQYNELNLTAQILQLVS